MPNAWPSILKIVDPIPRGHLTSDGYRWPFGDFLFQKPARDPTAEQGVLTGG
jgi:hypothetical protein